MGKEIVNVWRYNLEEELNAISEHAEKYAYISMDTEFPGVVAKPLGIFSTPGMYAYHQLRCNTSLLSLIQLGISLSNAAGESPEVSAWQFNFYFDRDTAMSAQESMQVLDEARIDFERHRKDGISLSVFSELLAVSGLLMNGNLKWVSFHSSYDFAYLVKTITGTDLPRNFSEFKYVMDRVFPSFYDIKYLISGLGMKSGLQDLAGELGVSRCGIQHQAGSDALLTLEVFHALKQKMVPDVEQNMGLRSKLFGLE